ncbi:hypothetical protein OC835_005921 [Tilletia horrida]|nr:hypothetical protein OC835_005921 [Tilletia horrida]
MGILDSKRAFQAEDSCEQYNDARLLSKECKAKGYHIKLKGGELFDLLEDDPNQEDVDALEVELALLVSDDYP